MTTRNPKPMLTAQAPAKINLCLYVGPRRPDGYHPVCTLMEKVTLFDRLDVKKAPAGGIRVAGVDVPAEQNTIYRAARALEKETGAALNVTIDVTKEIPTGAGLAGGSSDAAAALKLLAEMFALNVPPERLSRLSAGIGADVPFFLTSGPQLATGIGEQLEPVLLHLDYALVIAVPDQAISTAEAYRRFDDIGAVRTDIAASTGRLERRMRQLRSLQDLATLLHNDLEPAAISLCGGIAVLKEELLAAGAAGSLMSGSGSAVFGIFATEADARAAAAAMDRADRRLWVARPLRV